LYRTTVLLFSSFFPHSRQKEQIKFEIQFILKILFTGSFSFFVLKGEPVEVTVEIKVVSFGELNEANMV